MWKPTKLIYLKTINEKKNKFNIQQQKTELQATD